MLQRRVASDCENKYRLKFSGCNWPYLSKYIESSIRYMHTYAKWISFMDVADTVKRRRSNIIVISFIICLRRVYRHIAFKTIDSQMTFMTNCIAISKEYKIRAFHFQHSSSHCVIDSTINI